MLAFIQSRTFCFSSIVEKPKDWYMQDNDFACGSVLFETWSLTLREEHRLRVFEIVG
jgi:hypothetical protein